MMTMMNRSLSLSTVFLKRQQRQHHGYQRWMSSRSTTALTPEADEIQEILSTTIPHSITSFVNGQSLPIRSSSTVTANDENIETHYINRTPISGQPICGVEVPTLEDIESAVELSHQTYQDTTSQMSHVERGQLLKEMAERIVEHSTTLAILESYDTGIPIQQIRTNHLPFIVQTLEYYSALAISGRCHKGNILQTPNYVSYTKHEPLGVCVGIGGWNYPLMTMCWKICPALTMANTMIYKPSECTPLTAWYVMSEIWNDDLIPPNMIQILLGSNKPTGETLINHPLVAKVSLTGSTTTGINIAKQASETLKRTTLELGGKSPLLIFDDFPIERSVQIALESNFINNGQVCSNATRIFVGNSVKDQFIDLLLERLHNKVVMGNPLDENTNIGPVMMHPIQPTKHFDTIMGYIERAKNDPSIDILCGGQGYEKDGGYYVEPTIVLSRSDDAEIVQHEIFGPVMTILGFDTEEEVIQRANNTDYGLAAGLLTRDTTRAHRLADNLEAGNVWVNNWNITPVEMPFGPYKMSGYGQELGEEALKHYSRTKMVYMELNDIQDVDTFF